ncbi:PalH-domain-containing protein [Pseudovirgaria hyperparasitica]|uniref:PalH-domain-containing protein n=1 Tax=Pseudovirgaria hyperparasitica TaxID=470096 RepID=A0A6A6WKN6_9PEZI|nr:PalH-domain-containing protein [Pseudovirgaria hyperparasitica]KAF2762721.1 PalH-domain-containing protein [Pseudovirgaria hyperparasitica]
MLSAAHHDRRQIWNVPAAATPTTTTTIAHHCSPYTLPSFGVISIDASTTITLTADAVLTPECTSVYEVGSTLVGPGSRSDMQVSFNASVTPIVYATGAATVIAWFLFIMLVITPRTFFMGGAGGTSGLLGRRGMISGASGSASVIGVGSRPWLQKIAALTVAISLTIATADTFRVAEAQWYQGFMDAESLRREVVGGLEIKISRIISDIFLWLAQVQTLIRLFSRHKEKVIIKWTGFGLIVLDMTFSILNNFLTEHDGKPRHFVDAIPALNYLFQCALSMLYAAWVIYYALTKRRYAFYHKLMPNMAVVAVLSIVAILTPLIFFIIDISNYNVAGWGDYFRWVGAAAASVVVWEWVERIEALERDEKKDGILGREVFDGDDMLENSPHQEVNWPSHRNDRNRRSGGGAGYTSGHHGHGITNRFGRRSQNLERTIMVPLGRVHSRSTDARGGATNISPTVPGYTPSPEPRHPLPVASPVSRADTTSATNTVYTIRYHTMNEPMTPLPRQASVPPQQTPPRMARTTNTEPYFGKEGLQDHDDWQPDPESQPAVTRNRWRWPNMSPLNPFRRRIAEPPAEVLGGRIVEDTGMEKPVRSEKPQPPQFDRWDLKGRFGAFAAEQSERIRDRAGGKPQEMVLPVTIIPAQPRGRTWSPNYLANQAQETEQEQNQGYEQTDSLDSRTLAASSNEIGPGDDQQLDSRTRSTSFTRTFTSQATLSLQTLLVENQDQDGRTAQGPFSSPISPVSPISTAPANPFRSPTQSHASVNASRTDQETLPGITRRGS